MDRKPAAIPRSGANVEAIERYMREHALASGSVRRAKGLDARVIHASCAVNALDR